jgi:tetratricopeptide (TPR) repeat protein
MSDDNTPEAGGAVVLTLRGQRASTARLPTVFATSVTRGPDTAATATARLPTVLPAGLLVPKASVDLRTAAPRRGAHAGPPPATLDLLLDPDDVVVLELADGQTLITRADRLRNVRLADLQVPLVAGTTQRGWLADGIGEAICWIHALAFGTTLPDGDPVVQFFSEHIEDWTLDKIVSPAAKACVRGVVAALELRLRGQYGLRRWRRDTGLSDWPVSTALPTRQPLLVFVHDLLSDTLGSFGALQRHADLFHTLEQQFPGGVYGFDHRTLSCCPIENALALAQTLPVGARISLVTLGRGGLVADLLCVGDFTSVPRATLPAEQQARLEALAALLAEKRLDVQRYARVASPSAGTTLLGDSLDTFLSSVLEGIAHAVSLAAQVGWVGPVNPVTPVVEAVGDVCQRLVLEMVRLRADPRQIPGLAALLPDAPWEELLKDAPVCAGLQMAVLAGDTNNAQSLLHQIGLRLADRAFSTAYHDLLVESTSMLKGIAATAKARARLDCGHDVTHFRYFSRDASQQALREWLCSDTPRASTAFEPLEAVRRRLVPPLPSKDQSADDRTSRGLGGVGRGRQKTQPHGNTRGTLRRQLGVSVHAADLRFHVQPLLIGHYEQDPIAGPQAIVDRDLLGGALSQRHSLGLYPGPLGTASAILSTPDKPLGGAVIIGLGRFDEPLTQQALTDAVCAGALRFLWQVRDTRGPAVSSLTLGSLLIGTNSSSSLSVAASVEALVGGVLVANARFQATTGLALYIDQLQIIELYLDTAITAVYVLTEHAASLADHARALDTRLDCTPDLQRGSGARPRLFDGGAAGGNYWPRLLISDASHGCDEAGEDDRTAASGVAPPPTRRAPIATRLRFLHVGQRARAEAVVQQRQPDLIEQLVRQQIDSTRWNPDFGRALFQLMVPHALKDTLRHAERLVLVVDPLTANLPWELMLADDLGRTHLAASAGLGDGSLALALRMPLVRQLAASEFRPQVRQSVGRAALVIGNPSLAGFEGRFPGPDGTPLKEPSDLPGAADEAQAVSRVLQDHGHDVTALIDPAPTASQVMIALYRQPWRVLHICAHGVFALRNVAGVELTGVLLSDGVLITAAEIQAMELVPELVFLNCCHLGQMAAQSRPHRLAASIARELIEVGVRCVVVAGWAVSDGPAKWFGETFYQRLFGEGETFGQAVFEARVATAEHAPGDITWGAFQAYGDAGWRVNPLVSGGSGHAVSRYATPDELLDELARRCVTATQKAEYHLLSDAERRAQIEAVEALVRDRGHPGWTDLSAVQSGLGMVWFALGAFGRAVESLNQAIRSEHAHGLAVSIQQVEMLANALTRLAQQAEEPDDADRLLDQALRTLDRLDALAEGDDGKASTVERCGLRGSALKRRAQLMARRLGAGDTNPAAAEGALSLRTALDDAAQAYEKAGHRKVYQQLNALALRALRLGSDVALNAATRAVLLRQVEACRKVAEGAPYPWSVVTPADAKLVEWLLTRQRDKRASAFQSVLDAYHQVRGQAVVTPAQLGSMRDHLVCLADIAQALPMLRSVGTAEGLRKLAEHFPRFQQAASAE